MSQLISGLEIANTGGVDAFFRGQDDVLSFKSVESERHLSGEV